MDRHEPCTTVVVARSVRIGPLGRRCIWGGRAHACVCGGGSQQPLDGYFGTRALWGSSARSLRIQRAPLCLIVCSQCLHLIDSNRRDGTPAQQLRHPEPILHPQASLPRPPTDDDVRSRRATEQPTTAHTAEQPPHRHYLYNGRAATAQLSKEIDPTKRLEACTAPRQS